jgi:hypothetical protein
MRVYIQNRCPVVSGSSQPLAIFPLGPTGNSRNISFGERADQLFGDDNLIDGYCGTGELYEVGEAIGFQSNHLVWLKGQTLTPVTLKQAAEHMARMFDVWQATDLEDDDRFDLLQSSQEAMQRYHRLVAKSLK